MTLFISLNGGDYMHPTIEINIDETTINFEIDTESLSVLSVKSINAEEKDNDIEWAVELLNSPFSENDYMLKVKFNHNINLWVCERFVWWYDGCSAVLTTYTNNHQTAFKRNETLFNKLQRYYNPNNNSF